MQVDFDLEFFFMIFLENKIEVMLTRKVEEIIQPRMDIDIVSIIFDNLCHLCQICACS